MARNLTLVFILLLAAALCHAQSYNWITGGGSTENMSPSDVFENVTGMCTDANGNIYLTATVGKTNIKADTFYEALAHNTNTSVSHVLLASYKCDGTMRWAKLLECSNDTWMASQANGTGNANLIYQNGSIYLAGAFYGATKYIGTDTTFTNNPSSFTTRFDTAGHFKWIRFVGPDLASTFLKTGDPGVLAVDGQGYIHNFNWMQAGVQLTGTYTEDTSGTYDLKYDSSGNLVTANRVQLDSLWVISKAVFDKHDNKYFTILVPNSTYWYTYHASQNSALTAFQPNGQVIWMDTTGASGNVYSLAYDGADAIYVCGGGEYPDTFSFGGITVADTIFPTYYAFATVFKLDTNGHAHWVYNLQSNEGVDGFGDLTLLPNNKLAVSGVMTGISIHGTDTIISTPGEQSNPLFAIIDSSGHTVKLDQLHGPGNDDISSVIASSGGNVYMGGRLDASMTATGLTPYLTNGGNTDFFLVKYGYNDCDTLISLAASPGLSSTEDTRVYPNPATDELNITGITQATNYRLIGLTGIVLQQGVLQQGANSVSMKQCVPGIYILEMTGADGQRNIVRVVKE